MDGGAWKAAVHGVSEGRTQLSDFTFTFHISLSCIGEGKSWLKTQRSKDKDHGIQFHHFMANRWENNGNSGRLNFGGSKVTADGDCSYEIKRRLFLRRKAMTNLDSILKSRDITLLTKVHIVKATVFSVVMYGCESWTTKKAEQQRIDASELWFWKDS